MIILNLHIYDVDWLVKFACARQEICEEAVSRTIANFWIITIADGVEAPFFAGDDDVGNRLILLPSFWSQFNVSIPIEHRQKSIGTITDLQT